MFGNIALRAAPDNTFSDDPFEDLRAHAFPQSYLGRSFDNKCYYTLHLIDDSNRELEIFIPGQVEVTQAQTDPMLFWPGCKAAMKLREAAKAGAGKAPPVEGSLEEWLLEDDILDNPMEEGGGCGGGDDEEWVVALFDGLDDAEDIFIIVS
jgi:hypothetical protein